VRTAGIICIAIGLAVLMLVLVIPATSDFESRVTNAAMAMAAVLIVVKGLGFLRKSSRTPKTPFE
jgi:hypothetical protein